MGPPRGREGGGTEHGSIVGAAGYEHREAAGTRREGVNAAGRGNRERGGSGGVTGRLPGRMVTSEAALRRMGIAIVRSTGMGVPRGGVLVERLAGRETAGSSMKTLPMKRA